MKKIILFFHIKSIILFIYIMNISNEYEKTDNRNISIIYGKNNKI